MHGLKSTESLNTVASSDWQDPIEASAADTDQQQQPGGGRVISPEELRTELAIISTRDDAHRLIDASTSASPRFDCQTAIQCVVFTARRNAARCIGDSISACPSYAGIVSKRMNEPTAGSAMCLVLGLFAI